MFSSRIDLQRTRTGHDHHRVTFVELFFDLVFVFAVTQLSHGLLKHLTPMGAVETGLLFLAVWWVWIFTCWITNWLDPERQAVRLMLIVLMLAGLFLTMSLSDAFGEKGLQFACAFVFMQVGRSSFALWALRRHNPQNYLNFVRITAWLAFSGIFWIVGGSRRGEHAWPYGRSPWRSSSQALRWGSGRRAWDARLRPIGWWRAATWPNAARCS